MGLGGAMDTNYKYSIDPFQDLSKISLRLKKQFLNNTNLNNYLLHVLAHNIQKLNKSNVKKEEGSLYFITLIAPDDFNLAADKLLAKHELKAYKAEIAQIKSNNFEAEKIKAYNDESHKEPMVAINGKKYLEEILIQEFIEMLRKMYIPVKDFYGNIIDKGSAGDVLSYINTSNGMQIELDPRCSNIALERIPNTTTAMGASHEIVLHFKPLNQKDMESPK